VPLSTLTGPGSLLEELEDAIERGSEEQRAETLRRLTDLFLAGAEQYTEEQVTLFDDVICRLIEQIEGRALIMLGRRLASVANAPPGVVRRLARHDAIAVAGPVLLRSPRLDDGDLLDVSDTRGQGHLLAISGRRPLGATVTDVLVRRGNSRVRRSVASNADAHLSPASYDALVRHAEHDGALAERIIRRHDIPPRLFRKLLTNATEAVRKRLLAVARPEMHAEINRALNEVSDEIASEEPETRDYTPVIRQLMQDHPNETLGERDIVLFALSRRIDEVVAALSILTGLPGAMVAKVLNANLEPLLILCKAAGLSWPATGAVALARPVRSASAEELAQAAKDFGKLSVASARQVLRFWQSRTAEAI
jgi:hypothetical protein